MPPPSFTSATINTGNSGGPMFAMNEVVGIVSHNIPERRQRGPASS
jgi:S1-C subfamily serine protease